jgi:adenosylhomocysteine nucleosidase
VVSGVLVLTALELEAATLAQLLAFSQHLDFRRLTSSPFPAWAAGDWRLAPVGPRAACLAARWRALTADLDRPLVVSAGVCGGLDPAVHRGDLVMPETVIGPLGESRGVTIRAHRRWLQAVGPRPHTGSLVTTCEIAARPDTKAALRARTGAVAVDMESALILDAAAAAGCPSLVVRAVSDAADESLPPGLDDLLTPGGGVRRLRAVGRALARPSLIPAALRLERATRAALRAVAAALGAMALQAELAGAE